MQLNAKRFYQFLALNWPKFQLQIFFEIINLNSPCLRKPVLKYPLAKCLADMTLHAKVQFVLILENEFLSKNCVIFILIV